MITGAFITSCEQVGSIRDKAGGKPDMLDLIKDLERLYKVARDSADQAPKNVAD